MHLCQFAHQGAEQAGQAQRGLACNAQFQRPAAQAFDLRDDIALRGRPRASQVPDPAECLRRVDEARHDGAHIRHIDKLVRPVQRADHVGPAAVGRRLEGAVQQAVVHSGTVEVGQAQHGGLDAALCMGLQQQVLLGFAHATLEGMGLARMVFRHGQGAGLSVGIDLSLIHI